MTTFNKKVAKSLPVGIKVRKPRYYYQDIAATYNTSTTRNIDLVEFEGLDYNLSRSTLVFNNKKLWNNEDYIGSTKALAPLYEINEENVQVIPEYLTTRHGLAYSIVGNPVIENNVLKNTENTNYIIPNGIRIAVGSSSWEYTMKIKTYADALSNEHSFIDLTDDAYGVRVGTAATNLGKWQILIRYNNDWVNVGSHAGSHSVQSNTIYWIKAGYDKTTNTYYLKYSTNGTDYVNDISYNASNLLNYLYVYIGKTWYGDIYLDECSLVVDGVEIWGKNAKNVISVAGCLDEGLSENYNETTYNAFVKDGNVLLTDKENVEGMIWANTVTVPEHLKSAIYRKNYNVVGALTYDEIFNVSGFSGSNYISLNGGFNVGDKTWEVVAKFTTTASFPNLQGIYHFHNAYSSNGRYGLIIRMQGNKFNFVASSGYSWMLNATGSYTLQPNTTYWVKASFDGSKYVLSYSLDGKTYIDDIVYNSTDTLLSGLNIMVAGVWYDGSSYIEPLLGKLYIADCYMKIGDKVYRPMEKVNPNPSYFPDDDNNIIV